MNVTQRVALGAMWLMGARLFSRLSGLAGSIVLARLLAPQDYGLVAIAVSVLALVQGLTLVPTYGNLVRAVEFDRANVDTAFTIAFVRGSLVSLLVLVSAGVVADFVRHPELGLVLRTMALLPLFECLQNPRFVVFERGLLFGRRAVRDVLGGLTALAVAVGGALYFGNYWALVCASIASSIVMLLLSYVFVPYVPRFSIARMSEHLSFSSWLWMSSMVSTVSQRIDTLILGRMLDASSAGIYSMGRDIASIPTQQAIEPITTALFPALAGARREGRDADAMTLEAMGMLASVGLPITIGLALVATEVVRIILGDRWAEVAPILQWITPVLGAHTVYAAARSQIMATGHTKILFYSDAAYAAVRLLFFVCGLAIGGLMTSVVAIALASVLNLYIQQATLSRTLGIGFARVWRVVRRPVLASGVMTCVVLAVRSVIESAIPTNAMSGAVMMLLLLAGVGAMAFMASLYFFWVRERKPDNCLESRAMNFMRRRISRP
jgi:lipopolysaccharide exporter